MSGWAMDAPGHRFVRGSYRRERSAAGQHTRIWVGSEKKNRQRGSDVNDETQGFPGIDWGISRIPSTGEGLKKRPPPRLSLKRHGEAAVRSSRRAAPTPWLIFKIYVMCQGKVRSQVKMRSFQIGFSGRLDGLQRAQTYPKCQ